MDDRTLKEVMEEGKAFPTALGNAMFAWARVEQSLCMWFALITKMPSSMVLACFYSGKNASTRIDLVSAAIAHSPLHADYTPFLSSVVQKARVYSKFRNTLAHAELMFDPDPDSPTYNRHIIMGGKFRVVQRPDANMFATIEQTIFGEQSFSRLSQFTISVFVHARDRTRQELDPDPELLKRYLALVALLPTEAQLPGADQIVEGMPL